MANLKDNCSDGLSTSVGRSASLSRYPISGEKNMKADQIHRLNELGAENGRLKKRVVDLGPDEVILKEAAKVTF